MQGQGPPVAVLRLAQQGQRQPQPEGGLLGRPGGHAQRGRAQARGRGHDDVRRGERGQARADREGHRPDGRHQAEDWGAVQQDGARGGEGEASLPGLWQPASRRDFQVRITKKKLVRSIWNAESRNPKAWARKNKDIEINPKADDSHPGTNEA